MIVKTWILFAILMTVGKAIDALINEFFQVKPIHLLFWMRTISLVLLVPFLFIFPVPTDPVFYLYLVPASFLIPYADMLYVGLTARKGAGVVTRILPLIVAMIFVMWLPFSPDLVKTYINQPLKTFGIIAAITGSIFCAMQMRHCVVSFGALKQIMPALVLWSLATILGKLGISRVESPNNIVYYLAVQSTVVWMCYVAMMRFRVFNRWVPDMQLQSNLFDKKAIIAGLLFGTIWLMSTGSRWFAIDNVENPAYVSVIGLTAPFIVMLVYKMTGKNEKANIWSGIGIVCCAIILAYLTG